MKIIILLFIVLIFVVLAHILTIKYEKSLENRDRVEPLVTTDSDYSNCEVGCLIACSNSKHILQKECYCPCVDQCWNY